MSRVCWILLTKWSRNDDFLALKMQVETARISWTGSMEHPFIFYFSFLFFFCRGVEGFGVTVINSR